MGEFYLMTRKRLRRQVVEFVDVQGFDDPQGLPVCFPSRVMRPLRLTWLSGMCVISNLRCLITHN
jgi:hypothetical protein